MGNTLAPMQNQLSLADNDTARDAKETLDRLEDMAQDRIELFYDKIGHADLDKHLIPINKVLNKYTYIGVAVEESDVWIQEVREAVKEFAVGPIADGLSSVATNIIIKMLGSSAGRRQTTQRYAIAIDWLGGISRLDYYIFTYTFCSTELVKKRTSLIACCVVESSADVRDIDSNTLRVLISRAFRGGDIPHATLTAIYAQLVTAINQPADCLSLTEKEKESLEKYYNPPQEKKILPHDAPAGDSNPVGSGDPNGATVGTQGAGTGGAAGP